MSVFTTPKGTKLQILDLRGKDYMQVAQRLVWFREEHPTWSIQTTVVTSSEKYATVKATILDDKSFTIASAHKTEHAAHFGDFLEKAETGAVGRALALCGYGTQFAAVELEEGHRIVDAPQVAANTRTAQENRPTGDSQPRGVRNPEKPVTEPQLKRLHAIVMQHNWNYDDVKTVSQTMFNVSSSKELNMGQYEDLCNVIQSKSFGDWVNEQNTLASEYDSDGLRIK